MSMRVYEVEQGSPAWFGCRAGVITASMFKVARAKTGMLDERQAAFVKLVLEGTAEKVAAAAAGFKAPPSAECVQKALRGEPVGDRPEAAKNYAFGLAIERISGQPLQDDKFETYAMRRGHELEPLARRAHERLGIMVRRCGFITTADGRLGASTDGLIGDNGSSEYKCLVSPEGLRAILLDNDLSEFVDQLQGGLLVSEREWMHFGLYCPALEEIGQDLTLRLVRRDEAYITALRKDLYEFDGLVETMRDRLLSGRARNALCIEEAIASVS